MPGTLAYVDSSAIIKLVVAEPESGALRRFLGRWPERVSSRVAEVEVIRAARRAGSPAAVRRSQEVLRRIGLVELDAGVAESAGTLGPPALRSLDAIHLATALSLEDDLGVVVAYDERLLEAARRVGADVAKPA